MENLRQGKNRGTALFMAIVVCAIVCVFSLALLSLSYSVFAGEVDKRSSLAGREMTKSIARMIGKRLSDPSDGSNLSEYIRRKIKSGVWESGEELTYHLACDSTEEELNKWMSFCKISLYWEETGEKISSEAVEKTEEEADVNIEETEADPEIKTTDTDDKNAEAETTETDDERLEIATTEETEPVYEAETIVLEENGKRLYVRIVCDDGAEQYSREDIYTLSIVDGKWVWYPEKRGALADGER